MARDLEEIDRRTNRTLKFAFILVFSCVMAIMITLAAMLYDRYNPVMYQYELLVTFTNGKTEEFSIKTGENDFGLNDNGCIQYVHHTYDSMYSTSLACGVRKIEVLKSSKL